MSTGNRRHLPKGQVAQLECGEAQFQTSPLRDHYGSNKYILIKTLCRIKAIWGQGNRVSLRFRTKVGIQVLPAVAARLGSQAGCFRVNWRKSSLPWGQLHQDLSSNYLSNQIHLLLGKRRIHFLLSQNNLFTPRMWLIKFPLGLPINGALFKICKRKHLSEVIRISEKVRSKAVKLTFYPVFKHSFLVSLPE